MLVNHLSRLLGERRLSLRRVSLDTGIAVTTLYDLYHERSRRFDGYTLDRLCTYLGVGVGDILEYVPGETTGFRRESGGRGQEPPLVAPGRARDGEAGESGLGLPLAETLPLSPAVDKQQAGGAWASSQRWATLTTPERALILDLLMARPGPLP